MEPDLVDMDEMVIVGLEEKGADISALWKRFHAAESTIRNRIEGSYYELHEHFAGEHGWKDVNVIVGVQVTEPGDLTEGLSVRVLPPSRYAVFTHRLADGGYEGANDAMNAWLDRGPYRMPRDLSIQRFEVSRFKGGTAPDSEIDFLLPVVRKD
jgi:predicted transcriptional regulator YdeE